MEIFNNIDIDLYIIKMLSINVILLSLIIFSILIIIKFRKKFIDNYNAISISSLILSIVIIMLGMNESDLSENIIYQNLADFLMLLISIFLISISNSNINKIDIISNHEFADVIKNSSTMIANAIFIKELIIWMDGISLSKIKILIIIYFIFEIIQIIFAIIYVRYDKRITSYIYYSSYRIGLSLVMTGSFIFVPYDIVDIVQLIKDFTKFSIIIILIYLILANMIGKIIDYILNYNDETNNAIIKSTSYIALSILSSSLIW